MRAISAADCLNLWERGCRFHPLDQGLLALAAALPDTPYQALAGWPLGRRNRALVELRCACFGSRLVAWVACPQCNEKLELEMDVRTLLAAEREQQADDPVSISGRSYRLPTSHDLARLAGETDARIAARRLLEACRLEAAGAADYSDEEIDEIGDRLALADPMAETRLALQCAACGNQWVEGLDIGSFLWAEIEARARRLLMEIHALASAYGWTEDRILTLSEARRAWYVEMVQS
jgi:hypothetical protein